MPVSLDAGIIYESTGYGYQEVAFSEKVSGDDILSFDGKKVFITGVGEEQFNSYIPFGDDKYSWVTFKAVVYALFDYTATGYSGTYDEQYHTIGGIDVFLPESGATVKYGTVEGTYDSYAPPSYKDPGTYPVYYQITAPDYYTETGSVNIEIKKRVYDVTWKNEDGTLIDTTQVEEGDVPTHADATKAPDETYLYTFAGWTPEVSAATGDAEYTAVFESAEKVAAVPAMINALPTEVTVNDKADIEAARAAYDSMTDEQKALIDEDTYKKLTDAEDRINSYVLLGDADGDGEVTINDVTMMQKYIAGFEMPDNFVLKVCDTNCDGKITIDDATEIQKYVAEYEIPYPIGKMIAV